MTLIIGMYYNSGGGAVLVADSRTMQGGDYTQDKKLYRVGNDVVFAAAGLAGMVDKLLPKVELTRFQRRQVLPGEALEIFEDEMAELSERYQNTRPYRFSVNETLLNGIIGFLTDNKPKLHTLYDNGYAETIHDFHAVGHGARHAQHILRTLYKSTITKERAIEIAVHAMVEVSRVDAMVDAFPQVAILEYVKDKSGITIINEIPGNNFQIDCDEIERIKTRVQGIESTRTKIFHMLLDGDNKTVTQIEKMVKEYEHVNKNSNSFTNSDQTGAGESAKGKTGEGKKRKGKTTT